MASKHGSIAAVCATDKLLGVVGADAILHQGLQRVRALNRTGMNSMLSELDERYLQVCAGLACGPQALSLCCGMYDGGLDIILMAVLCCDLCVPMLQPFFVNEADAEPGQENGSIEMRSVGSRKS